MKRYFIYKTRIELNEEHSRTKDSSLKQVQENLIESWKIKLKKLSEN